MVKWLALLGLTGCSYITDSWTTSEFSGDPFPIYVQNASGALVIGMNATDVFGTRTAVIDVMSPITLVDLGPAAVPRIDKRDLTLIAARTPGADFDLPRALLVDKDVVTLHPCDGDTCEVGTGIGPRNFDALIGANALAGDALRLRVADDEILLLPDIAGSGVHRARSCDAQLPGPFRGGGTLVIGGTELGFSNWRIAIDTCIEPNPDPLLVQSARGVDALFVLSTALGASMINQTTYDRIRMLDPSLLPIDQLPVHTVFLPSGPVEGNLTSLPSFALVGNSSSNPRAPCRQMYAHHLLSNADCMTGDDCPCTDGDTFCSVPSVTMVNTRISVLVVPDAEPTLQALRTELRPDRPEVDGILGTEALTALELDIDYPHDRLLARCADRTTCVARPELSDRDMRPFIGACIE